jgi:hypothetical protein
MTDVIEVVSGKSVSELDAVIAAAIAEKENAKLRLIETLNAKADEFKTLCAQAGVKAKSYFVEKNEGPVVVYANPADPSQTYSKGPRPPWLKAILEGITDKKAVKAKMAELIVA